MPKSTEMLSDKQIAALEGAGFYNVGGEAGVYLQIGDGGGKSWILRVVGADGKRHDIGLGPYPAVLPGEARSRAKSIKSQIHEVKLDRKAARAGIKMPPDSSGEDAEGLVWVTVKQLAARYSASVPTIWRWARETDFPNPVHLTTNCTRWKLREVLEWEKGKESERR